MAAGTGTDITWWAVASAFGGTIIGSVLGGAISYWLQRRSLAATRALHDADRHEARKASGYSLFFKMIRLSSDLAQLGKPVREAVETVLAEPDADTFWPKVLPIAPLPDPIKFQPDEMALILSLDSKLFNDMAALDDLHKNTIAIFALYAEKRNALTATLKPVSMTGQTGSMLLTPEERMRMKPLAVELDLLVQAMVGRTQQDGTLAWECLKRLHAVLEREFKLRHKLELKEEYKSADAASPEARQPYFHHYKG